MNQKKQNLKIRNFQIHERPPSNSRILNQIPKQSRILTDPKNYIAQFKFLNQKKVTNSTRLHSITKEMTKLQNQTQNNPNIQKITTCSNFSSFHIKQKQPNLPKIKLKTIQTYKKSQLDSIFIIS
jgi:hypothetical protein